MNSEKGIRDSNKENFDKQALQKLYSLQINIKSGNKLNERSPKENYLFIFDENSLIKIRKSIDCLPFYSISGEKKRL